MCGDLEPLDAIVARLVEKLGAGSSLAVERLSDRASAPHGSERGGGPSATVIEFRKKGRAEAPPSWSDGLQASGGSDADAITTKGRGHHPGIAPELFASASRVRGPAGDSTVPPCRLRLVGR